MAKLLNFIDFSAKSVKRMNEDSQKRVDYSGMERRDDFTLFHDTKEDKYTVIKSYPKVTGRDISALTLFVNKEGEVDSKKGHILLDSSKKYPVLGKKVPFDSLPSKFKREWEQYGKQQMIKESASKSAEFNVDVKDKGKGVLGISTQDGNKFTWTISFGDGSKITGNWSKGEDLFGVKSEDIEDKFNSLNEAKDTDNNYKKIEKDISDFAFDNLDLKNSTPSSCKVSKNNRDEVSVLLKYKMDSGINFYGKDKDIFYKKFDNFLNKLKREFVESCSSSVFNVSDNGKELTFYINDAEFKNESKFESFNEAKDTDNNYKKIEKDISDFAFDNLDLKNSTPSSCKVSKNNRDEVSVLLKYKMDSGINFYGKDKDIFYKKFDNFLNKLKREFVESCSSSVFNVSDNGKELTFHINDAEFKD